MNLSIQNSIRTAPTTLLNYGRRCVNYLLNTPKPASISQKTTSPSSLLRVLPRKINACDVLKALALTVSVALLVSAVITLITGIAIITSYPIIPFLAGLAILLCVFAPKATFEMIDALLDSLLWISLLA